MKLNHGRYQQLTGDSSLDEQTLHSIQTGIDSAVSFYCAYKCAPQNQIV